MEAVNVYRLSKTYTEGKKAVDSAIFTLDRGEVFGFLGPNGAGKTTTVKLLNGMLEPTEGTCRVFDLDPSMEPHKVHQIAGVVTEHAQMYDHLSGFQNLVFYGNLFGVGANESDRRAKELLDKLGLSDAADQKLGTYSTGMRQRLSLARAMIHEPQILFLDEPTSGLDPESVQSVNSMIKSLAQDEGRTVFLCTHQLRYAQEICTSYGLIDDGRMLASGNIEKLRSMVFAGLTVSIKADRMPEDLSAHLTGGQSYEIPVQSEAEIPAIVSRIVNEGGSVYHVSARRLSLEEIYFSLIEDRKKKEGIRI